MITKEDIEALHGDAAEDEMYFSEKQKPNTNPRSADRQPFDLTVKGYWTEEGFFVVDINGTKLKSPFKI